MLLPIKKFYKLFKDPEKPEDELTFNWDNEKLLEVKTKKKSFLCINGKPVLIDFSQSIIKEEWFKDTEYIPPNPEGVWDCLNSKYY